MGDTKTEKDRNKIHTETIGEDRVRERAFKIAHRFAKGQLNRIWQMAPPMG